MLIWNSYESNEVAIKIEKMEKLLVALRKNLIFFLVTLLCVTVYSFYLFFIIPFDSLWRKIRFWLKSIYFLDSLNGLVMRHFHRPRWTDWTVNSILLSFLLKYDDVFHWFTWVDVDCHYDALSGWACMSLFGGGGRGVGGRLVEFFFKDLGVGRLLLPLPWRLWLSTIPPLPPRLDPSGGLLSTINLYRSSIHLPQLCMHNRLERRDDPSRGSRKENNTKLRKINKIEKKKRKKYNENVGADIR